MDRLRRTSKSGARAAGAALLVAVLAGCGSHGRPKRLLYGEAAAEFRPVAGSVISQGRVLRRTTLGRRLESCLFPGDRAAIPADAVVVERIGVSGESLTFANRRHTGIYACDGGVDPAGERPLPWCGTAFGRLVDGRLLDPRLDVLCQDRKGHSLGYAFVEPVAGARWIGVDQGSYTEIYEVLAGLPVRVASARNVRADEAKAEFDVTQYDVHGRELVTAKLEAAVAG
ncbi:MAG TPA: hypothetical protein VF891_03425 [Gaiellaceae bacterium]